VTFSFAKDAAPTAPPHQLTYLIGEPGSGKSTLAAHLTRGVAHAKREQPFAHMLYASGVYELGKRRPDFPGTDALSMSVQPMVLSWMRQTRPFLILGEGDRLGTASFFDEAEEAGFKVWLYVFDGAEQAALQRRIRGSDQDESWVDSRRTKVANIAKDRKHVRLPVGASLRYLEDIMLENGDPVVSALRGLR
jgi:energy-coupling factor transporter ATP-binding protein EcfA2